MKEQSTIIGTPAQCDEACTEFLADGWTLHSVVPLGDFFKANHPQNGPQPYLAYIMQR